MTKQTITTEVYVTVQQLAAEIVNTLGRDQDDGWFYANLPIVEKLLRKYGHRLEKPDEQA